MRGARHGARTITDLIEDLAREQLEELLLHAALVQALLIRPTCMQGGAEVPTGGNIPPHSWSTLAVSSACQMTADWGRMSHESLGIFTNAEGLKQSLCRIPSRQQVLAMPSMRA